jgi:hyperosmotically inducible periplasmic protein
METPAMHRAVLAFTLALVPAAAGCEAATNAANGAGAVIEKTAEKVGQQTSDASITIAVKGALMEADDVLGKNVKVGTANSGVVSLSGTVPTPEHKARAEAIALKVKGVVRVLNVLDVGPPR